MTNLPLALLLILGLSFYFPIFILAFIISETCSKTARVYFGVLHHELHLAIHHDPELIRESIV